MNKDACRPQPSRPDGRQPRSPGVRAKKARGGWETGRRPRVGGRWRGGAGKRRCGTAVWLRLEGIPRVRERRLTQAAELHGRGGGSRAWTPPPPPTSRAGSPHERARELGAGRRAAGGVPTWVGGRGPRCASRLVAVAGCGSGREAQLEDPQAWPRRNLQRPARLPEGPISLHSVPCGAPETQTSGFVWAPLAHSRHL